MPTTVRAMIAGKRDVYSVAPEATVFEALQVMAERNVGAVLVLHEGRICGIFSERDYARKIVIRNRTSRDTPVRDVMTAPVVCVSPQATADDCMALMTDKRIRHLPVLDGEQLAGIISIGDVVRAVVDEQQRTISDLVSYIVSGA